MASPDIVAKANPDPLPIRSDPVGAVAALIPVPPLAVPRIPVMSLDAKLTDDRENT